MGLIGASVSLCSLTDAPEARYGTGALLPLSGLSECLCNDRLAGLG